MDLASCLPSRNSQGKGETGVKLDHVNRVE